MGPGSFPPHPPTASISVGPTSSMKAPTKLKATRPSSSNLKELSVMFLSPSGPCRRPGTRMRPTRTEPKSARATRKGTGGGGVCQQWRCALGRMHTHIHTTTHKCTLNSGTLFHSSCHPLDPTPAPPRGSTVGVEWLTEGCPLRHCRGQEEVLEAREREDHRVLVVRQVVGCRHRSVQGHEPGDHDGGIRERVRD